LSVGDSLALARQVLWDQGHRGGAVALRQQCLVDEEGAIAYVHPEVDVDGTVDVVAGVDAAEFGDAFGVGAQRSAAEAGVVETSQQISVPWQHRADALESPDAPARYAGSSTPCPSHGSRARSGLCRRRADRAPGRWRCSAQIGRPQECSLTSRPPTPAPWCSSPAGLDRQVMAGTSQSGVQVGRRKPVIQGGPVRVILSGSPGSGYGRVCEVTSGCFVAAKQEKR
jgi:hypothetical protein